MAVFSVAAGRKQPFFLSKTAVPHTSYIIGGASREHRVLYRASYYRLKQLLLCSAVTHVRIDFFVRGAKSSTRQNNLSSSLENVNVCMGKKERHKKQSGEHETEGSSPISGYVLVAWSSTRNTREPTKHKKESSFLR